MEKLFSTQYGSVLYGTNTPTSDIDWKHIVLPQLNDLLIGRQIKNIVQKTNSGKFTKNSPTDIDEEFIPIQVFAKDFLGGQSYALELAFAIDGNHAGQVVHNPLFLEFAKELRTKFLSANVTALIGYSVHQASLYSFKGERLNAVREFREIIECLHAFYGGDVQLGEVEDAFKSKAVELAAKYPKYVQLTEYEINNDGDRRPCVKLLEKTVPYTNSLDTILAFVDTQLKKYGARAKEAAVDNVDWKATSHAMRIVNEGILILTMKRLTFPLNRTEAQYLRDIKSGKISYDKVIDILNERLELLKKLELEEKQKPQPTSEELKNWLADWMFRFYGIQNPATLVAPTPRYFCGIKVSTLKRFLLGQNDCLTK